MRTWPKKFVVVGRGPFPFDMLRHDGCWPASPQDAAQVGVTREPGADCYHNDREVTLYTVSPGSPCVGRWNSFGWIVKDTRGNDL